jgi:ribosomal protein S27AE
MSSADWWAAKLGNAPAVPQSRPMDMPPMPPSQQPMAAMPAFNQQPGPAQRAQSANQTQTCPECGSANYMAVANAGARCYDCGYPIQQSGSRYGSLTGAHVEGSAKPSIGNDGTSNWNPQGIIGRID